MFNHVQHDLDPVTVEVTTGDDIATLLWHALRHRRQAARSQEARGQPGSSHVFVRLLAYSAADQCLSTLHVVDLAPPWQQQHGRQPASHSAAAAPAVSSGARAASADITILAQLLQDLARIGAAGEAPPSRGGPFQSRLHNCLFLRIRIVTRHMCLHGQGTCWVGAQRQRWRVLCCRCCQATVGPSCCRASSRQQRITERRSRPCAWRRLPQQSRSYSRHHTSKGTPEYNCVLDPILNCQ